MLLIDSTSFIFSHNQEGAAAGQWSLIWRNPTLACVDQSKETRDSDGGQGNPDLEVNRACCLSIKIMGCPSSVDRGVFN